MLYLLIALLAIAAVLVEGIMQMGVIDMLIDAAEGSPGAAVLIVSGAIKVSPIQLVKHTSVPMIAATILNTLFAFMFIG